MELYKLCFVFVVKLIFQLYRQSTTTKNMKAKIKYNNIIYICEPPREKVPPRGFIQIIYDVI